MLLELDLLLQAGQTDFIALTTLWRRVLAVTDDDKAVARHQAAQVHRLRKVLARRGVHDVFVLSVLERTDKHGLHGHLLAACPRAFQAEVLDLVEAGLARRYGQRETDSGLVRRGGSLPSRTLNRDGWRRDGSITTPAAALGATLYRLKSLPSAPIEHGVRRGVGLKPVEGVSVRCSTGRPKPPARP